MQNGNNYECENIQTQLSAYYDKELPSWKRHIVRWHLKRCAKCEIKYKELNQTQDFLHSTEPIKASDAFLSHVMSRVNLIKNVEKDNRSLINRFVSFVDRLQVGLRGNIRSYNSYYIIGFFVGVFMMLGVTLYTPKIEKLNLLLPFNTKTVKQQERLVAFEVIIQPEPKRTLKIR